MRLPGGSLFEITPERFRVIDLSLAVTPPGTDARPFQADRGLLADDTFKHAITTHTHVGTHIESPSHFNETWARLEDFPTGKFMGRAVLFDFCGIDREGIDGVAFQRDIGDVMRPDDIVLCRNTHPKWRAIHQEDRKRLPYLTADGARWLIARKAKMLVIDDFCGIRVADGKEISRENHAILMAPGADVLLLEMADGLEQLRQKELFFMALPVRFAGVDSMWTRAIAIERKA